MRNWGSRCCARFISRFCWSALRALRAPRWRSLSLRPIQFRRSTSARRKCRATLHRRPMVRLLNTGEPLPRVQQQSIAYLCRPALHRRSIASRCLLPRRCRPMVRLPRIRESYPPAQSIAYRRPVLHRRSIASQRLLPRRCQPMVRLLNLGEPLPPDRNRILHRPLISRRRLPMNRSIRGRGQPMAHCPACATCRARPARLVPVRASQFLANLGVPIRSILHFHRKSVRSLDRNKSCLRNSGARKSSTARPSPPARSSSTRRIRISISCSAMARHCATALEWAARGSRGRALERISRLAKWPDWNPPAEMIAAAIYGRRGRQSIGCARPLFGQHHLSHSRDQPAFYDRHVRFVRLYSAHQRRRYRPLWPSSGRYACRCAPRPTTCNRECRASYGVWSRVGGARRTPSVDRPPDSVGTLQSSRPISAAVARTSRRMRHPGRQSPRRPPAPRRSPGSAQSSPRREISRTCSSPRSENRRARSRAATGPTEGKGAAIGRQGLPDNIAALDRGGSTRASGGFRHLTSRFSPLLPMTQKLRFCRNGL
jgi:hypothetical protein